VLQGTAALPRSSGVRELPILQSIAPREIASKWGCGLGAFGEGSEGRGGGAAVEAERRIGRKVTEETRYFISSLRGSAKKLAEAARKYWDIENSLHWALDVTMNEDRSRIRKDHAPENLALLRRLALNLIKKTKRPKASVRGSIKKAGWDNSFLETILVG